MWKFQEDTADKKKCKVLFPQRDGAFHSKIGILFRAQVEWTNLVFSEMVCNAALSFLSPYISQHLETNITNCGFSSILTGVFRGS